MAPFPSTTLPLAARRGGAALAALLASVSLAACTTDQSAQTDELPGAQGEVQKVVKSLSDRADDGDAAGICSALLTENAKAAFAKNGDCAAGVKAAIDAADYITLDVKSVKVTGDEAVATVTRVDKDTGDSQLVLERGAAGQPWKIAAFGDAAAKAVAGTTATTPATTPSEQ